MKFYLVIIQNDSTQAVFSYDSYDSAMAKFHTELAYRGEGRNSTVCVLLNRAGELVRRDEWIRQPEPEPELEEPTEE